MFYNEIKEDGRIINAAISIPYNKNLDKELGTELEERSSGEEGIENYCDGTCGGKDRTYPCTSCGFTYVKGKITGCKCKNDNKEICCHILKSVQE